MHFHYLEWCISPFILWRNSAHMHMCYLSAPVTTAYMWSDEKMQHILWIFFLLPFGLSPGTQIGHFPFLSHLKWGKVMTSMDSGQCHHCWGFYAAMNSKQNWVAGYLVCRVEFVFIRYIPGAKRKSRYSSTYHKQNTFLLLFSQRNKHIITE